MANTLAITAIASILVGIAIGYSLVTDAGDDNMMDMDADMMGMDTNMMMALEGTITIGHIVPLTGDLSLYGNDSKAAVDIAVDNYNEYLDTLGVGWDIEVAHENSQSSPAIALEKLTDLKARGIDVVIGPYASSNVRALAGYVESNNMLLISPSSTAPQLAIEGDSIFRLIADDNQQSKALAKIMSEAGIDTVVTIQRGDAWGDGLYAATKRVVEANGGTVDESIRYNPDLAEFAVSSSLLAENVQSRVDERGASRVGVLSIGFAETIKLLQDAADYEILDDIKWFCTDGYATEISILEDEIALNFASNVSLSCTQGTGPQNPIRSSFEPLLTETVGHTPNTYAYSAYDALWIAGNAVLDTQSTDASVLTRAIPEVAFHHNGSIGNTKLNSAGDLDASLYAIWILENNQWVNSGTYSGSTDRILPSS